jgi:hypothetical protein
VALLGGVALCHWKCNGCRRWPNDSVAAQGGFERTHERNVIIMEIKRAGSQPSAKGPSDWFTGSVRIDPLFQAPQSAVSDCLPLPWWYGGLLRTTIHGSCLRARPWFG